MLADEWPSALYSSRRIVESRVVPRSSSTCPRRRVAFDLASFTRTRVPSGGKSLNFLAVRVSHRTVL